MKETRDEKGLEGERGSKEKGTDEEGGRKGARLVGREREKGEEGERKRATDG